MDLLWIEELLPEGFQKKRMFGGYAFYRDERLVLLLFDSDGNRDYRGKKYEFELWKGAMFPVEKEKHENFRELYPFLVNHPVLPKWFYLPLETEDFDSHVQNLLREIRKGNELFGTIPQSKKRTSKKAANDIDDTMDTRRPRMFSEEPAQKVIQKARRISDLKNLGPESEKAFHKAGIKTPQQFFQMGWKKAMVALCKSDPKNNHSIFAYAVIGALQNKIWNGISESDKQEARQFMKSLRNQKTRSSEPAKNSLRKKKK